LKSKLQSDAEHDWTASLELIRDQAKLETLSRDNEIDNNKTSTNRTITWMTTTKDATRPIVKKRMVAREMMRAAAVMTMNNMRTTGAKQLKRTIKLNLWEPDSDDDNEEN
jgi:hypothetical protein